MATATSRSFDVVTLEGLEPESEQDGRAEFNIRRHFGIGGFGVRANRAVGDGHVINEHNEVGIGLSGQEELYLVVSGAATFNVDGERVEAPAGTLVFVRNPAAKRSAIAKEEGTTVLAIGGTPGEAYRISAGEAMNEMWEPYNAGDYETALEKLQPVLEERPEALVYFNVACVEARLGRTDDAIGHLQQAVEADDRIKENIRTDEDLDSLRDDPRFVVLAK
jgi:tetratricopeptide (TPR) repeat protein